jgi:hypothetical protein
VLLPGGVLCRDTPEELTEANRLGLKRGWFDDLLIVGINLVAVRVKGATKLHGVGRFGGWNVFGEQKIRVSLSFAGASRAVARIPATARCWILRESDIMLCVKPIATSA